METWFNFSGTDIALAVFGLVGLSSVIIVLTTASSNVNKRERTLRARRQVTPAQSETAD